MALLCLLGLVIGPAISRAEPEMRTGLRESTPEELARLAPYKRYIREVRLTPLGRQRIVESASKRRVKQRSLTQLTVQTFDIGEDLVLAKEPEDMILAKGPADLAAAAGEAGTPALPVTVDNSALNAFPSIGQQSGASCEAFSSTYYMLTHMLAMQRGSNAKTGGDAFHMSPKWTYNMLKQLLNNGFVLIFGTRTRDSGSNEAVLFRVADDR